MNEELNIKIKVDTSAITPAVNKIKNEVSNVNKQVNSLNLNKTTDSANKSTNTLHQAISKLTEKVKSLNNINFGKLTSTITIITAATYRLEKAISNLQKTSRKTQNPNTGHFRNALASLNPNSDLYKDIEWEGKDAAWNNFNENALEGIDGIKMNLKNTFNSIKNFKMSKFIDKIKTSLSNIGSTAKSGLGKITSGAKASAAAVASAGAALTGFISFLVKFNITGITSALLISRLGDKIYHSAQQFGFSTKAFQEWSYIMERNGSSIEDLKGFLETLNSEQGAVITGSEEAAQKFRNLGISAEEAASMDSQTLFETTIAKLQGIEDATLRSSYAYEMFGDEASRLMNIINMSSSEMGAAINQYNLLGGAMSGELIESSTRLQGSIAGMKQAWQGIANTLATVFIPVVQAVVNWITKAIVIVNLFFRSIFGLDLKSTAKGTEKALNSTKQYTGGLKAATKAAEQLKRTTMGFDELNIVQDPNKSSGGDAAGGGASGLDTSGIPTIDDSMLNMDNLNLDKIYEWFEEYKGVIAQITTWSLILIGVILTVIGGLTGNIPLILLGSGMAALGITIGNESGVFEDLGKGIKKLWDDLSAWFNEYVAPIFTAEFWANLWDKVKTAVSEKLGEIGDSISEKWDAVKQWFADNIAPKLTVEYWKELFNNVKQGIKEKLEDAKTAISEKWDGVKQWFADNVAPKFTLKYWKDVLSNIKDAIKEKLGDAKTAIEDKWNSVKKWFSEKVGSKFTKEHWKEIFNSIPQGIKGAINSAIEAVEKGINYIVRKVNTISFKIPDWVPKIGGGKFGFNLKEVSIPRLAEGGIATRSVLANIGEAGKEAVLPLEYNTEWMDTLADKIAARNGGPTKVVLQVNDKELGWATIDSINSITKQTGAIQLTL